MLASKNLLQLIVGIIIFILFSCSKPKSGEDVSKLPTVVTLQAGAVTSVSVEAHGRIIHEGTDTVTEKGFCFGLSPSPGTGGDHVVSTTSSDSFAIVIKDLLPKTPYYLRAYAINSAGTAYGETVAFKTPEDADLIDPAETIYLGGGRTPDLFALDAATGSIKWRVKISGNTCTSPIFTNNTVVVQSSDNKLYAFDPSGKAKWTRQLEGVLPYVNDVWPAPICNNGIIYAQSKDFLYAVNSIDGTLIWQFTKHLGYMGDLIYDNHTLYCNVWSDHLYAIDAESGRSKWQVYVVTGSTPCVLGNLIYMIGQQYNIEVHDAKDGHMIWDAGTNYGLMRATQLNVKYGRIYTLQGQVLDSATATQSFPDVNDDIVYSTAQPDGLSPILEDNLAINWWGVRDAITGQLICRPQVADREPPCGTTYLNHKLFYQSSQREYYDQIFALHYFSDAYGYDIKTQKLLWTQSIEDANFFGVEPCVVTKSGVCRRGGFVYR